LPELLWTASHVHDFICIIYMHTATSIKLTCFSLHSHQQATAYLWPSITNWFWCQSRINYYNSRWIVNVYRVLCHTGWGRTKNGLLMSFSKLFVVYFEVQRSSSSKVMTFTLIPFCPEVTQQTQLLWTYFVHGLVTHESLWKTCPQLSNRTVFNTLFIQKLLKEIVPDNGFCFQHIKI